MPTYPTCTFCGKNDSKPSKEHVIPKWMTREFPNATFQLKYDISRYVRKTKNYINIIAHHPCTRCNNGWLSDLEKAARPILVRLIHGTPTMLSVRDQVIIRTWFFTRAVMFDIHATATNPTALPRPRYFDDDEHRALMSTLSVHPKYLVFIGRATSEALAAEI